MTMRGRLGVVELTNDTAATGGFLLVGIASSWRCVQVSVLDGVLLLDLDRLWWRDGANNDMHHRGCTRPAASRSQSGCRVVEDVSEMQKPEVGSRLGFRLRPSLWPIVPDVRSNDLDSLAWVESPGCALPGGGEERDELRWRNRRRRGGVGGAGLWLCVCGSGQSVGVRSRDRDGGVSVLGFVLRGGRRDGGEIGDDRGETGVFVCMG